VLAELCFFFSNASLISLHTRRKRRRRRKGGREGEVMIRIKYFKNNEKKQEK